MIKSQQQDELLPLVLEIRQGDRASADVLVMKIRPLIYAVVLRFLWSPQDSEDVVQEILIKVITRLSQFSGKSLFSTWVYAIASNHLLDLKRRPMEESISFDEFADDLSQGIDLEKSPEDSLLLEEVKIGCTLAMLQCLDRNHRVSYILGEILELDHQQASAALTISAGAFRKRLSRARTMINDFMLGHCGLINPENSCRCSNRVPIAKKLGRVDASNLIFSSSQQAAKNFPEVLIKIRTLEQDRRAAALYQSQSNITDNEKPKQQFTHWLSDLITTGRIQ
jgi:RNA polymerase sigma factor (sigma-70 family)